MTEKINPSQPLPSVMQLIEQYKARQQGFFNAVVGLSSISRDLTTKHGNSAEEIHAQFEPILKEIAEAMTTHLTRNESPSGKPAPGPSTELCAIQKQGDFVARMERAESLRRASYSRRRVFAGARKRSHASATGYFNRRLIATIVDQLKQGATQ